jgi:hypothetical protein
MAQAVYGGEVWTDERGRATVVLPGFLRGRELAYEYELHPLGPGTVHATLLDGRLTITSNPPHMKVTWRLTPRLEPAQEKEIR